MLLAMVFYAIMTGYAIVMWRSCIAFQRLGGTHKKWAIPILLLGSLTFGAAEVWLISEATKCAVTEAGFISYSLLFITVAISAALTACEIKMHKKMSEKTAIATISAIAMLMGYLITYL